MLIIIT